LEAEDIDPDKPLFLYLSFLKPHAGLNVPKEFEDLYDIDEIPDVELPPWSGGSEPETHISNIKYYNRYREAWHRLHPDERKRTTLRYWANCSWLDHYFGKVLSQLEKLGRLDNSIIVFLSDHGEMLGERDYMFTKYNLYESSVRVPMILSGSAISESKRGTVDERPAELIDIIPTLANVAGAYHSPVLTGLDLLSNDKRVGSFCEFHGKTDEGLQAAPAYMWRKKDWKLIVYIEGPVKDASRKINKIKGELYCLKDDPKEWDNLYGVEEFAKIREQMKTELLMHLACAWAKGPAYYEKSGYKKLGTEN
jgi:arylsulfatase A-like enzyme